jgi:hypothetical protein
MFIKLNENINFKVKSYEKIEQILKKHLFHINNVIVTKTDIFDKLQEPKEGEMYIYYFTDIKYGNAYLHILKFISHYNEVLILSQ